MLNQGRQRRAGYWARNEVRPGLQVHIHAAADCPARNRPWKRLTYAHPDQSARRAALRCGHIIGDCILHDCPTTICDHCTGVESSLNSNLSPANCRYWPNMLLLSIELSEPS